MTTKLKRDQLPPEKAKNWKQSLKEERDLTFNLKIPHIILEKSTYKELIGENENRVRIYLGLEKEKENGAHVLCAFAVAAFLLGSGEVYADYETPVFLLGKKNVNMSDRTAEVIESIRRYRSWRDGELDAHAKGAEFRKYIYPNAYLLTKYELHELFNVQGCDEIRIEFGISKTMEVMVCAEKEHCELRGGDDDDTFNGAINCPPYCDKRSIYNV